MCHGLAGRRVAYTKTTLSAKTHSGVVCRDTPHPVLCPVLELVAHPPPLPYNNTHAPPSSNSTCVNESAGKKGFWWGLIMFVSSPRCSTRT